MNIVFVLFRTPFALHFSLLSQQRSYVLLHENGLQQAPVYQTHHLASNNRC